ncbi:putative transcriptional regulator [Firmicutes bacterium CAG:555]|nr:putative transcriptional regulator [Firmicutes bacterium CAG:555]
MEISERLKQARITCGMTQEQVTERVMVSRVTLSHWENGKTLPDITSLISLSDIYQISLDELLKGDPKMTEKVKKDAKDLNNRRVLLITAILALIVMMTYTISLFVGGNFKAFTQAAAPWLIMGIGVAVLTSYSSQTQDSSKKC